MTRTVVWCSTRFEALHFWPDAAAPVEYLKNPHRHEFHVKLGAEVVSQNRQIEFITLKAWLNKAINENFVCSQPFTFSCEQMAQKLIDLYKLEADNLSFIACEVSEDGENGATVCYES